MRLLMTADAVGGVWTYAMDLAEGLAAFGWETTLAVLGPRPGAQQRSQAAAIAGLRLVEQGWLLDWADGGLEAAAATADTLAALATEHGVDLVQLNSPVLAADGRFGVPVIGVAHSCPASWWQAAGQGPIPPAMAAHARALHAGYRGCDLVIAPSASFAAVTADLYGIAPPIVVHNGRAAPAIAAPRTGTAVLAAGRLWDRGKGMDILDRAAPISGGPVFVAGSRIGPEGDIASFRHIHRLGALPPGLMAHAMATAGIFVAPSRYEPFGLAVLEAAQHGCALVLSDIPSFRELWSGAALFVAPDDHRALAAAIAQLRLDAHLRQGMAEAARDQAGRYTRLAMARTMAGIFDTVSGRAAAPYPRTERMS